MTLPSPTRRLLHSTPLHSTPLHSTPTPPHPTGLFGLPLPRPAPVTVLFGRPINVGPPKPNPTPQDVQAMADVYFASLREVFEEHKHHHPPTAQGEDHRLVLI